MQSAGEQSVIGCSGAQMANDLLGFVSGETFLLLDATVMMME